jgi:hypothetical protein
MIMENEELKQTPVSGGSTLNDGLGVGKCEHSEWKKEEYPPRHCLECGAQMWDAGD